MASSEVVTCEWCFQRPADSEWVVTAQLGKVTPIPVCDTCKPRCSRFSAALAGLEQPLLGTDWLHGGRPDLVMTLEGKSPVTVKDARQLKQKALRELLPKPPKQSR